VAVFLGQRDTSRNLKRGIEHCVQIAKKAAFCCAAGSVQLGSWWLHDIDIKYHTDAKRTI